MSAEVVAFHNLSGDIVKGLRALADRIERGEEFDDDVKFVICAPFTSTDQFRAYAWGTCSTLEALGAYALVVTSRLVHEPD